MEMFKTGDRVRFCASGAHDAEPQHYPEPGTVGTVVFANRSGTLVRWPLGSTSGDDCWWCVNGMVEFVECYDFEPGDRVRFLDAARHKENPEWYPEPGTIGTVVADPLASYRRWADEEYDDTTIYVQWPEGSTSIDDRWTCGIESVEVYE